MNINFQFFFYNLPSNSGINIRTEADMIASANELKAKGDADIAEENYYKMETEEKAVQMMVTSVHLNVIIRIWWLKKLFLSCVTKCTCKDIKPSFNIWQMDGNKNNTFRTEIDDIIKTNIPMIEGLVKTTWIDLLKSFRNKIENYKCYTISSLL